MLAVQSLERQVYSRARVTGVASDKKAVTVAFLDSGLEDRVVNLASLFQLPASLNEDKFPAEAMKARLVGLRLLQLAAGLRLLQLSSATLAGP